MKQIRNFTLLLILTFLFGMTPGKEKKLPPYLIPINDSTYIDRYEITIEDYGYFLIYNWRGTSNKHSIDTLLPRPNYVNWFDGYIYEVTDTSLGYPVALWYKPIINITKKQAEQYCEWRTRDWQRIYEEMSPKDKAKYYKDVVFRLPDYSEWKIAAGCGLDTTLYPTGNSNKSRLNDIPVCWDYFSQAEKDSGKFMPQGGAEPWIFGIKNDWGIFNMCGNVAELIRDKDFVAGGSFRDPLGQCRVSSIKPFKYPNVDTGFRCVAIIKR